MEIKKRTDARWLIGKTIKSVELTWQRPCGVLITFTDETSIISRPDGMYDAEGNFFDIEHLPEIFAHRAARATIGKVPAHGR